MKEKNILITLLISLVVIIGMIVYFNREGKIENTFEIDNSNNGIAQKNDTVQVEIYAAEETEIQPYYIDGKSMITLVNAERTKAGVDSLTYSNALTEIAKIRAEEICRSYSHTRPDEKEWYTVSSLSRGENLASGNSTGYITGEGAFNDWMNSQGHRENILRPQFKTIGIAGYYCSTSQYKYKWVQIFGY